MSNALETAHLSKRYGRTWALQDCTLALPAGRVAALVGPNGAGKTTLLNLSVGILEPTAGSVQVLGSSPLKQPTKTLPRLGFVAQDHPLYQDFTVADLLTLDRRAGKLSGGQQAQVALVLALAKRPELLLLDEPLASLDPLARREFLRTLLDATIETGLTVLLSSHIIGDLERVCDYLIILSASQVQLVGDLQEIGQTHKRLIGPRQNVDAIAHVHTVIEQSQTERQTTLLVRANGPIFDPSWEVQGVSLEDIMLAYLGRQAGEQLAASSSAHKGMEVVQ